MDLSDVFGVNVEQQFTDWFEGEFTASFIERYPGKGIALVILDPDYINQACLNWESPLAPDTTMIELLIGHASEGTKPDGVLDNVAGKLRFVLRTGQNSIEAEKPENIGLLREGDFTWEGAGEYRGYVGGVSGLAKHDDWLVFRECVDKLDHLIAEVNTRAKAIAAELREQPNAPVGSKYMRGIKVEPVTA